MYNHYFYRNHNKNQSFYYLGLLICILLSLLSSCKTQSKAILYKPNEVAYLSNKLNIPLINTDKEDAKNIPLYVECMKWLDVPYKYGGSTKKGSDCSGFVNQIYKNVYQVKLPRSTAEIYKKYNKVNSNKLQTGDLIFFATGKNKKKPSHVGIYLKDQKFIHASTQKGVIVTDLDDKYYKSRKLKGVRVKQL